MCRTERLVTEENAPVYEAPGENGTYCYIPIADTFGCFVAAVEIPYENVQNTVDPR